MQVRSVTAADREAVAKLIHASTNHWYVSNGRPAIFRGDPLDAAVFFDVYQALDPDCALVVEEDGQIIGSCFYHPRETHMSLGIMNVHGDHFGKGVARKLLSEIIALAESRRLPLRLVSSAMNLDSFSLYTRAGFTPRCAYQDMTISVPAEGLHVPAALKQAIAAAKLILRNATPDDAPAMADLERELMGIRREKDYRYFIANEPGFWHVSVCEDAAGQLQGFCASSAHPACNMVGPGVARTPIAAAALLLRELDHQRGRSPVFLVPVDQRELVAMMYALGARNCELHFTQVRGECPPMRGVNMPTFLPESG